MLSGQSTGKSSRVGCSAVFSTYAACWGPAVAAFFPMENMFCHPRKRTSVCHILIGSSIFILFLQSMQIVYFPKKIKKNTKKTNPEKCHTQLVLSQPAPSTNSASIVQGGLRFYMSFLSHGSQYLTWQDNCCSYSGNGFMKFLSLKRANKRDITYHFNLISQLQRFFMY